MTKVQFRFPSLCPTFTGELTVNKDEGGSVEISMTATATMAGVGVSGGEAGARHGALAKLIGIAKYAK